MILNFQITRFRLGIVLKEALIFHFFFTWVVCFVFDAYFHGSDAIFCFNILNPKNIPSGQVGLCNWCIS